MNKRGFRSDISVLIPAYNAEDSLERLLPELLRFIHREQILVCDDGSSDKTSDTAKKHGVNQSRWDINRGKGYALAKGFEILVSKGYRWVLTMDADLQHSVSDIRGFVDASETYPDTGIIIGARRFSPVVMPPARIVSNVLTSSLLSCILLKRVRDSQSGFRLYSAEVIMDTDTESYGFDMETEMIMRAVYKGFSLKFIDIQTLYCSVSSYISHFRDTIRWCRTVLSIWLRHLCNRL